MMTSWFQNHVIEIEIDKLTKKSRSNSDWTVRGSSGGRIPSYEWDNSSILNIKSWSDRANEPYWSVEIINLKFYRGWQIGINQWLHQLITQLNSIIFCQKYFFTKIKKNPRISKFLSKMKIFIIFLFFGAGGTNKEMRFTKFEKLCEKLNREFEHFYREIWQKFHFEATTGTYYEISPSQQLSLLNEILECPTSGLNVRPEVDKTNCTKYESFVSPNDGKETEVKVNFYVEEWVINWLIIKTYKSWVIENESWWPIKGFFVSERSFNGLWDDNLLPSKMERL